MANGDDPCQSIVDAIDALNQNLLDLEAQEQGAIGVERTVLQGLIRHDKQRIQEEQSALKRCRANPPAPVPPPFVSTFSGIATVRTDNGEALGPFRGSFSMPWVFSHDHRVFVVSGFRTKIGKLTVTQSDGGRGDFDPALGASNLEIAFNVDLGGFVGDGTLAFFSPGQFTTEQARALGDFHPHGSRLVRSSGDLTLAGTSTITDNVIAGGTHVEVLLAGTLTPLP
jgi:hypothetical protein